LIHVAQLTMTAKDVPHRRVPRSDDKLSGDAIELGVDEEIFVVVPFVLAGESGNSGADGRS